MHIPISENYPHFLWRVCLHPRKALRAFRAFQKMPSYYWIEITSRCNLRCRSCFKSNRGSEPGRDMDLALFNRIVDEAAPHAEALNLTGFGEFFFHRQVDAVFERLMQWPKINLWLTTNGKLLTEEWLRRLARRNCNVIFSIDGADQETHGFNRPGSDLEGLRRTLRRARELELASPDSVAFPFKRHINFLVMRNNMRQMPQMINWAREANVTSLRLSMINDWQLPSEFWKEQNPLNYRDELIELLKAARARAAEKGVLLIAPEVSSRPAGELSPRPGTPRRASGVLGLFKPSPATRDGFPRFEDRYCRVPFNSMYISAEGKVSACCAAWYVALGDARKQTIRRIWNGLAFRRLRTAMTIGSHTSCCRVCDLPFGLARGNPRDDLSE